MDEMTNDAWFRMFPGDWESGTARLRNDEVGAYDRLIMNYYKQGPLPSDIETLQGLTRVKPTDWARIWGAIGCKFHLGEDGLLHQIRCDKEIKWRNERIDKLLRASQMGVEARRKTTGLTDGATGGATDGRTDGSTNQSQSQNQIKESDSESKSTFDCVRMANEIISDRWGWWWDNCKVKPSDFKTRPLASVIEAFLPKSETEIQAAWIRAVKIAHAAAVDGLIKDNAAGYCIQCFRDECK